MSNDGNSGVGLLGALFLVFVALKLTGYITWSWWWVTAPLWGAAAIWTLVFIGVATWIIRGGKNRR